ncbi:MAG: histidine--tRNA ligase [Candidatus Rokubacteria bacterium]|nr:histidine--tRNA ligase [Candidatus Rokubacteria bacterium]
MTQPRPIRTVRGVRDILPGETVRWQRVEAEARRVFEAHGYREIRLPLFERTELFARGIGETTDIVEKEMYTFQDRSGESLTLRPEATASLLRAYIEHGLHVQPKPVRLYTLGPMFRYERPQAGRYRQFHQINVEALGEAHPALDAEVIGMLMELFRALGLAERLALQVNSIGDEACRPAFRERLAAYLREHAGELCPECRGRIERNPLRVLDCKRPGCQPLIDKAPSILEALCPGCREHFERVRGYLDALGLAYRVNPRMVRGLDYYVRTTFEVLTEELGAQNALAGGGRYDGLIQALGGPPDPGIGFAIGVERVTLLLGAGPDGPLPTALLIPLGEAALTALLPLAQAARRHGVGVEVAYGRKLRGELERAHRLGVPYVVIVGEDELRADRATLRDMASGAQRAIPLDRLPEELAALGRPG